MASGYISGKKSIGGNVNIPTKSISYTGLETDTAEVVVNNDDKTIAVNVNVEEVTKNSATKEELAQGLSTKQDVLVSGENIKTINDESILGSGNITLSVNPIKKVESLEDVPDNDLGLYRYTEEDLETGDTHSSHIIEVVKEEHAGGEVSYEKITTSNNVSLSDSTFMNQFDSELSNFISVSSVTNVYSLYYSGVPFNGIRIGTKNVGTISLNVLQECDVVIYKYFSYNGQTGVKTYDANSRVLIDQAETIYDFEDDETPIIVHLTAGGHDIESNGQNGRIILTAFEVAGEPYDTFSKHELARVEEVEEVQDNLDNYITESTNRFATDEMSIQNISNDIETLEDKVGPIQIFKVKNSLPQPSEQFVDKIFRLNEKYYQCVKRGDGEHKEFNFNVTGSSEVTLNNYEAFMHEVSDNFDNYYEIPIDEIQESGETTEVLRANKLFRNSGTARLGSSSYTGYVDFVCVDEIPTSLKVGVKAYRADKPSCIHIEDNWSSIQGSPILIESTTEETLIDIPYLGEGNLEYLYLESQSEYVDESGEEPVTIQCDKRVVITRIIADFGDVHYEWVPIADSNFIAEWDSNKDDYTQDELKEIVSHQVLYLINEDRYYYKIFSESVIGFTSVVVEDDGIEHGSVSSLFFNVTSSGDIDDFNVYTYHFSDLKLNANKINGTRDRILKFDQNGNGEAVDFFSAFTHSLAELDETLRDIIQDSIADSEAKPCTPAQWNTIKSLLDKSLYFNYDGVSYIRLSADGINSYLFGAFLVSSGSLSGSSLNFYYEADIPQPQLSVEYLEL